MNLQLHCSTAEILHIRGPVGSSDQAYSFSILLKKALILLVQQLLLGMIMKKQGPLINNHNSSELKLGAVHKTRLNFFGLF